jgi:hypothetical protein
MTTGLAFSALASVISVGQTEQETQLSARHIQ